MFRKRLVLVTALVALTAACDDDSSEPTAEVYAANLSGAAERPDPNTSTATGTASFRVNANRTITYNLAVTGMTPTAQHIHGPADANTPAGVIVGLAIGTNLTLVPGDFTGTVSYDSLLVLLRAGNLTYVNVHSQDFPAGEIRGNLAAQ
jgi:pectate lyase